MSRPTILWDQVQEFVTRKSGLVDLGIVDLEALAVLVGRINRDPVRFVNHIALAETLLLTNLEGYQRNGPGRWRAHARFAWMDNRGPCEDSVVRFTGWQRWFRPQTGRWERLTFRYGSTVGQAYEFAEDALPGGFEALWP